jgi:predicted esterase
MFEKWLRRSFALPQDLQKYAFILALVEGEGSLAPGFDTLLAQTEKKIVEDIETLKHQSKINENRIMLAGFSLGGDMSFALTLRNPDRFAGALIMSSEMNYRSPRYFERLRGKKTRMYLTMGSVDGRLSGMRKSKNMLDQYGIKAEMKIITGQGHEPPPREEFLKGMQFILSAPDSEAQRRQVQTEQQRLEAERRLREEQQQLQADQERLRQEREKPRGGGSLPGPQVALRDDPQPPAVDPAGPPSSSYHMLRGGCESFSFRLCGSGCRHAGTMPLPVEDDPLQREA